MPVITGRGDVLGRSNAPVRKHAPRKNSHPSDAISSLPSVGRLRLWARLPSRIRDWPREHSKRAPHQNLLAMDRSKTKDGRNAADPTLTGERPSCVASKRGRFRRNTCEEIQECQAALPMSQRLGRVRRTRLRAADAEMTVAGDNVGGQAHRDTFDSDREVSIVGHEHPLDWQNLERRAHKEADRQASTIRHPPLGIRPVTASWISCCTLASHTREFPAR